MGLWHHHFNIDAKKEALSKLKLQIASKINNLMPTRPARIMLIFKRYHQVRQICIESMCGEKTKNSLNSTTQYLQKYQEIN